MSDRYGALAYDAQAYKGWRDPGLLAALVLLAVYSATLARGLTLWDAGEFLAAIHSLGIPHPPGTPLYILAARVWSDLTGPIFGFAHSVNLFSAVCMAAAFGVLGHLLYRWIRDPIAAFAAAICAGVMSTVWLNATETEVYASSLLMACLILWTANCARETRDPRWILLMAYLCGLGWSLHLTALLTLPAAIYLILSARIPVRTVNYMALSGLLLLGASAVLFMLIRAPHDPAINQGDPATWTALQEVIQRKQYSVAPLWPRQAPWWLQLGNIVQYADWQFALGLHGEPGPAWSRTSITVAFFLAGIFGCVTHRSAHRVSWYALGILILTGTVAVAVYLNLKAGPSFGYGILPDTAVREARERDYFFILGFVCWGLWAGYGLLVFGRRYGTIGRSVAFLIAVSPMVFNWKVLQQERSSASHTIEVQARAMLDSVPDRAVFLAVGDNDTYPLWYLQEVERFRRDVIVVTVPLLGPSWYREELGRRYSLLDASTHRWLGLGPTLTELREHAALQGRPVVSSPFTLHSSSPD